MTILRARWRTPVLLALLSACAPTQRQVPPVGYRGWQAVGGSRDSMHYSALSQITRANVHELQVAWTYETGDATDRSEMQCNPIVVDGVLYATSPKLTVFALDAATGRHLWSYRPPVDQHRGARNRGVVHWQDGADRRIFFTANKDLYALDARTGKPIATFGSNGRVDMREGLGRPADTLSVTLNSPGIVYKDLIIIGSVVPEGLPAAPGDIRAYDARTGKMRWIFHTIPHPGEPGYETWPRDAWTYAGGANSWPGLTLDEKRGLLFAPTGSASFDFHGGNRVGDNLYANTLLALKAATGERVWHFQTVKHDIWDRDLPAAPSLVTVRRDGRLVDAVAQTTKSGFVFVFERMTGKPLFPIQYEKVPPSDVDGEVAADSQPIPTAPPPFARQHFTEDIITRRTPAAHHAILEKHRKLRHGRFRPPSLEGTVLFSGMDGGAEWGGSAFDPETGLLYVNSNEMAWIIRLVERGKDPAGSKGKSGARALYRAVCANCHREDMKGNPPEFPSLLEATKKRTRAQLEDIVAKGNGRMPAFSFLDRPTIAAVMGFVVDGTDGPVSPELMDLVPGHLKYGLEGYTKFLDPDGYPAVEPPWGTLNAIDLDTGRIAWKVPFGEIPALVDKGLRNTGSENYGGPVVTAGGLLFIGATDYDRKFHAYDKATGQLLWETTLPAGGNATPAVYEAGGRQFVVIAAGGGKKPPSGGSYVAFALPR